MKPEFIVWHCSASPYGTAGTIRNWHLKRGWRDIGYHGVVLNGFLTREDFGAGRRIGWLEGGFEVGRVWDGDGFLEQSEVGAHAYGMNRTSLGLCLIGENGHFTLKQLETALDVTRRWMPQFGVHVSHVIGHYEIGRFYSELATDKTCPDLDMDFVRNAISAKHDLVRSIGGGGR